MSCCLGSGRDRPPSTSATRNGILAVSSIVSFFHGSRLERTSLSSGDLPVHELLVLFGHCLVMRNHRSAVAQGSYEVCFSDSP